MSKHERDLSLQTENDLQDTLQRCATKEGSRREEDEDFGNREKEDRGYATTLPAVGVLRQARVQSLDALEVRREARNERRQERKWTTARRLHRRPRSEPRFRVMYRRAL